MKNTNLIIVAVALIVGAGAGFFGGLQYQKTQTLSSQSLAGNRQGNRPFGNGPGGPASPRQGGPGGIRGGAVMGEIISADGQSITVKLPDSSSKIVMFSEKTTVNKSAIGSVEDLKAGERVAVFGSTNPDGSVTALNIQLNPMMRMGGSGAPRNSGTKSADAKEIVVSGSNFKFAPNSITIPVGQKTRILFKSTGGFHDFKVDELNIATAVITDGSEDFVEFTPTKAGTYKFYCSVGNHRAMGMEGTIIVK